MDWKRLQLPRVWIIISGMYAALDVPVYMPLYFAAFSKIDE
jgi:hypothetical protein